MLLHDLPIGQIIDPHFTIETSEGKNIAPGTVSTHPRVSAPSNLIQKTFGTRQSYLRHLSRLKLAQPRTVTTHDTKANEWSTAVAHVAG